MEALTHLNNLNARLEELRRDKTDNLPSYMEQVESIASQIDHFKSLNLNAAESNTLRSIETSFFRIINS